jgi:proline racemase
MGGSKELLIADRDRGFYRLCRFDDIDFCLDDHTCGNPPLLGKQGALGPKGSILRQRRLYFRANHDWIHGALMVEPPVST